MVKVEFEITMPALIKGEYVIGAAVSEGEISNFNVLTWLYNTFYVKVINNGNNSALIDVESKINIIEQEI